MASPPLRPGLLFPLDDGSDLITDALETRTAEDAAGRFVADLRRVNNLPGL